MTDKKFGLIGRKLGHSYSLLIHREFGNMQYKLYELEPEKIGEFLADPMVQGVNVTIPYKKSVIKFCDELSPLARQIGSVNTIIRRPDGSLFGHNTDAGGFEYMASSAGIVFEGKKVLILGNGGASATIQQVVNNAGARQIVVVDVDLDDNYNNLDRHFDSEIIVNATPVGMYPNTGEMLADPAVFPHCTGVLDIIFNPRRTAFIQAAEALGIACADGLPMLVEQAREAAALFLTMDIPTSETERVLSIIRRQTGNIILIGMPGSGKSVVGEQLSKLSGRKAVDIDAEIVRTAGRPITEIFEKSGEEEFRRIEREQIKLAGKESGNIIITGGGAVKDERNYALLHQNGRIYQISRPLEKLARDGRPLSVGADLNAMYLQRASMYERFRDSVIENNDTIESAAEKIWSDYNEHIGD